MQGFWYTAMFLPTCGHIRRVNNYLIFNTDKPIHMGSYPRRLEFSK